MVVILLKIKERLKNILRNSGFKDILVLSSGIFLAQLITLVCQPIATRLYSPAEFGMIALIISTVAILSPLLTLQYHMGIVTAKTDEEANVVCALTFYILSMSCLILAIVIVIVHKFSPQTFADAGNWVYIVIPLLLLSGIGNIVDSYNNRFEQYKLMSSISMVRSIVLNSLRVILGYFHTGFLGLIISHVVSIIFGIRRQAQYITTKYKEILKSSIKDLKTAAFNYKDQPLFSMPGLFVTTFSFSILPIFISSLYGLDEAGYFSISMTALGIPLSLISSNTARVFFRKAALEKERKGNFHTIFKSTAVLLIMISIIGFTILWFIAEPLFAIVFGHEWLRSGTFVKILVPMYAIRFIVAALMHGFIISGRQLLKLILQSVFVIESVTIYFFAKSYNFPIEDLLGLINITYCLNYMILFVVLYFTSKKTEPVKGVGNV